MKARTIKGLLLPILFLWGHSLLAFVHQRTPSGQKSKWPDGTTVTLHVKGDNSSAIASSTIVSIASSVSSEWNEADAPNITIVNDTSGPRDGQSDLFFSNNSNYFASTSVLAVTETVFNEANGKIIESDIIIKDSVLYSAAVGTEPYIGDLISHEVGHLLGLDHGTLPFASMFYKLVKGQGTPSFDDTLGLSRLYNPNISGVGIISGSIAGSSNLTPVFGAEVDLISAKSGRVIASVLSESNGSFEFRGIPLDDIYYIFVKPTKVLSTTATYYQTARTDFCTGFASYKGGFFETCNSGRRGHPQGIPLNSSQREVNIGVVSIKCDLKVPIDYFSGRAGGEFVLSDADRAGDSFVGFFSEADIISGEEDTIKIDLSHIDTSSGDLYLDLSLLSQDFQSKVAYELEVTSPLFSVTYGETIDTDLNPNLNMKGKIPLDSFTPSNNIFEVKVKPIEFNTFLLGSNFPTTGAYFPDFSTIGDERYFYQFIFFIGKGSGLEYSVNQTYDYRDFRGNAQCMDGEKTYSVRSTPTVSNITSSSKKASSEAGAIACGTIAMVDDSDDDQGPGPMTSLVVGLLMAQAFFFMRRSRFLSF